jgi:hypothetical protein
MRAATCLLRWRAWHKEFDLGNDPWKCSVKLLNGQECDPTQVDGNAAGYIFIVERKYLVQLTTSRQIRCFILKVYGLASTQRIYLVRSHPFGCSRVPAAHMPTERSG